MLYYLFHRLCLGFIFCYLNSRRFNNNIVIDYSKICTAFQSYRNGQNFRCTNEYFVCNLHNTTRTCQLDRTTTMYDNSHPIVYKY